MAYCPTCRPIVEQAIEEKREHNREMRRKKYKRRPPTKYREFYLSKPWKNTSRAKLESVSWRCEAHIESAGVGAFTADGKADRNMGIWTR